jgi:hypothetical protein
MLSRFSWSENRQAGQGDEIKSTVRKKLLETGRCEDFEKGLGE